MNLADRLNKALSIHNLSIDPKVVRPIPQKIKVEPEPVEPEPVEPEPVEPEPVEPEPVYETIHEAILNNTNCDDFGTYIAIVKTIELDKIELPMSFETCMIDDIQKKDNGIYEIHYEKQ